MKAAHYLALGLISLAGAGYFLATPQPASNDLFAILCIIMSLVVLAVGASHWSVKMNQNNRLALAQMSVEHSALYERAVVAAGAQRVSVAAGALNANVTGKYRDYNFSVTTETAYDGYPINTVIWLSGNLAAKWPTAIPYRKSAWKRLPPERQAHWAILDELGDFMPEATQIGPGRLAFVLRTDRSDGDIPKDFEKYRRSLDALASVARDLDHGLL